MDLLFRKPHLIWETINTPWLRIILTTVACAIIEQIIHRAIADSMIPAEHVSNKTRSLYRLRQHQRANFLTRGLMDAISALFFIVVLGSVRWLDPLYQNSETVVPVEAQPYVRVYFEMQIGRFVFEVLMSPEPGIISIIGGMARASHVVLPMAMMLLEGTRGGTSKLIHLSFIAQSDLIQMLVDFGVGDGGLWIPWWLLSTLWAIFCLGTPSYAIHKGRFGTIGGRGAYACAMFFQFLMWLALPGTTSNRSAINPREARLRRKRN